ANGEDANNNGIPDSCEPYPACNTCGGDMNGDNLVNGADIQSFIACYLAFPTVLPSCGCADLSGNHQVTSTDLSLFVNKLLAGGCP
ncbi:MAG TPA: dockerin type I domain-containing protein, partial [Elusimicrobiota bacterium]|nr:dockerin type I domain-containing protein [Elusimicrobiota bacterium]